MAPNCPVMARMSSSTQDVDMTTMFSKNKSASGKGGVGSISATASYRKKEGGSSRASKKPEVSTAGVFASRQGGTVLYGPGSVYHRRALQEKRRQLRPLLNALRFVESSNRVNVPDGDDGTSIGPLQISEDYHKDAWQAKEKGVEDKWDSVRQLDYAENTVVQYWMKYCPDAVETMDFERLARTHNGGPQGAKRESTAYYWSKVMRHLREQGLSIPENATHLPPRRPSHLEEGRLDVKLTRGPKPVAQPLPRPEAAGRQKTPPRAPPGRRPKPLVFHHQDHSLSPVHHSKNGKLARHTSWDNAKYDSRGHARNTESSTPRNHASSPKENRPPGGLNRCASTGSFEIMEAVGNPPRRGRSPPKRSLAGSPFRVISKRTQRANAPFAMSTKPEEEEVSSSEGAFVWLKEASRVGKGGAREESTPVGKKGGLHTPPSPAFSAGASSDTLSPSRAFDMGYWNVGLKKLKRSQAATAIQAAWRMYKCRKAYLAKSSQACHPPTFFFPSKLPRLHLKPPLSRGTTPRGTPRSSASATPRGVTSRPLGGSASATPKGAWFKAEEEETWLMVEQEEEVYRQLSRMLPEQPASPWMSPAGNRVSAQRPFKSAPASGSSTPLTPTQEESLLRQLAVLLPPLEEGGARRGGTRSQPLTPRQRVAQQSPLGSPGEATHVQVRDLLQGISQGRSRLGWSGATTPDSSRGVVTPSREDTLLEQLASLMYPPQAPPMSWESRKMTPPASTTPTQQASNSSFKPKWASAKSPGSRSSTPWSGKPDSGGGKGPQALFRSSSEVLKELEWVLSSGREESAPLGEESVPARQFGELDAGGLEEDDVEMSPRPEHMKSLFKYLESSTMPQDQASASRKPKVLQPPLQVHVPPYSPPSPLSSLSAESPQAHSPPETPPGSMRALTPLKPSNQDPPPLSPVTPPHRPRLLHSTSAPGSANKVLPAGRGKHVRTRSASMAGEDKENVEVGGVRGGSKFRAARRGGCSAEQGQLAELCEQWEAQHVDLLERATKYLQLCSGGYKPDEDEVRRSVHVTPEKIVVREIRDMERARARLEGREERADLVRQQKDCIYTNISARSSQAERLELYAAWGIRRWSVGRLRRLVYKQLWVDPERYEQSAILTLQFL